MNTGPPALPASPSSNRPSGSTRTQPILTGGRIWLRPLCLADAPAIFAWLDEPTARRLTGTHAQHSLGDVEAHCARIELAEDRYDYAIMLDQDLIGEVVLNAIDWANKSSSLRIAIWDPALRDHGFGTEAIRLLVDFAFSILELNRIELEVFDFNPRARHVYEKIGFRWEGTRREALFWAGEFVDAHILGLLRNDDVAK